MVQRAVARAVPSAGRLRQWAALALGRRRPGEITLRVVGARESRALNRRWRGKDQATNVLSFPYAAQRAVSGDLVLCAAVIHREARAQRKTPEAHWAHMVIHGVLHLLGHDHAAPREAAAMERIERRLLARLSHPDPYESRA